MLGSNSAAVAVSAKLSPAPAASVLSQTFDEASAESYGLMVTSVIRAHTAHGFLLQTSDSMPRFINSSLFRDMVATLELHSLAT